jgi:hypothetical protein
MRFIEDLCPPALLYMIFLVIQLGLDASLGMWITMTIKAILGLATVVLLDTLCSIELGVVSWFLVAAPFLITSLATAIAMSTRFDEIMLRGAKEKFLVKGATIDDLPADSNEIGKVKTDSNSKMM